MDKAYFNACLTTFPAGEDVIKPRHALYKTKHNNMRYLLLGLIFCVSYTLSTAQNGQNTLSSSAESDPKAKIILEQMRDKYEGYKTIDITFELEIKLPEEAAETQIIRLKKKGAAYRVEMPDRTVISDGETLWMVLARNQEVQINDVPEVQDDQGILSPEALFRLYETDDFAYYLVGQATENGKVVQKIEFKPLDAYADYSKMRLTLVKGSNEFVRVKAFGKDGARFTITVKDMRANTALAATLFTFDKADYPGYYIEDLRY